EQRLRAWTSGAVADPGDHFHRLSRLLQLEADEEARQSLDNLRRLSAAEAERTGECLAGLVIAEESSGLGGRCILSLVKRNRTQALPWNRLEPGTPVILSPEPAGEDGWRGVVCERSDRIIRVALGEPPDETEHATTHRLSISNDEVAR